MWSTYTHSAVANVHGLANHMLVYIMVFTSELLLGYSVSKATAHRLRGLGCGFYCLRHRAALAGEVTA